MKSIKRRKRKGERNKEGVREQGSERMGAQEGDRYRESKRK